MFIDRGKEWFCLILLVLFQRNFVNFSDSCDQPIEMLRGIFFSPSTATISHHQSHFHPHREPPSQKNNNRFNRNSSKKRFHYHPSIYIESPGRKLSSNPRIPTMKKKKKRQRNLKCLCHCLLVNLELFPMVLIKTNLLHYQCHRVRPHPLRSMLSRIVLQI